VVGVGGAVACLREGVTIYSGPVIDCDVHHEWPRPEALLPYLSEAWKAQYAGYPDGRMAALVPSNHLINPVPGSAGRVDAYPAGGGPPGSDYELMREQLLEPFRVERAILGFGSGLAVSAISNPYFACEVARAANDWSIDTWLESGDDRLYGGLVVATQLPEAAAAEIRRVGGHPRIVDVRLCSNGIGKPFGDPLFHPIYEAAVETGLVVALHIGGEAGGGLGVSQVASAVPTLYMEHHMLLPQGLITHVVSLIAHGVFEKFPELRVLLVETGVAWLPWFLWRFDSEYRGIRRETPWLRKLPSEYFREHVRVTTQPLEQSPRREQLIELLSLVDAQDLLCFSSDYPHWDTDDLAWVAGRLPPEWAERVFRDNAANLYGWN
jgi:predicted TIM-barrel fold metal-dependent hydrolase